MPRTPEKNQKIKDERERSLLKAAFSLLKEKGLSHLSFNELGKRAKVSHGLVYHYFENKDDLVKAMQEAVKGFRHAEWGRALRLGSFEGLSVITSFYETADLSEMELSFALFEVNRNLKNEKEDRAFGPDPLMVLSTLLEQTAREELIPYGDYKEKGRALLDYLRGYLIRKETNKKATFDKAAFQKIISY